MSQIYYTIEKMVGDMWQPLSMGDVGDEEEPGEPEFDTEDEAQAQIDTLAKPRTGRTGKNGEAGPPVRAGSYRIVQKQRLRAGIVGAPSAPGALDPPVVARMSPEEAKKRIDQQRKDEDERFERSGVLPPLNRPVDARRGVSGSPYFVSQGDRITSSGDIGAKVGMAARKKASGGGEAPRQSVTPGDSRATAKK